MIPLKTATLKAALQCSATKDIRSYLCGVSIIMEADKHTSITSSTGHILFNGLDDCQDVYTDNIIIPNDAIKSALSLSGKSSSITLVKMDDTWKLGDIHFTPINAKYPGFDSIKQCPSYLSSEFDADVQFSIEYLAIVEKALQIASGSKEPCYSFRYSKFCILRTTSPNFYGLVMMRVFNRLDYPQTI